MTHRLSVALATCIVLATGTATAFAQTPAPSVADAQERRESNMTMHPHGMRHWDEMDTNHDGKISAAEHAAWAKAQFEKMDANHDGFVTQDEMHAHMKARMDAMMKKHRAEMFDRIDTNHDGMISRDEMDAAMQKMHGMRGHVHGDRMMTGDGMHDDMDDMQPPPPTK